MPNYGVPVPSLRRASTGQSYWEAVQSVKSVHGAMVEGSAYMVRGMKMKTVWWSVFYLWFTLLIMIDCSMSPAQCILVSSFGYSPSFLHLDVARPPVSLSVFCVSPWMRSVYVKFVFLIWVCACWTHLLFLLWMSLSWWWLELIVIACLRSSCGEWGIVFCVDLCCGVECVLMMRSASDVSVSNDAPEMVMIRLGMMKLLGDRWCLSPFPLLVVIMRSILMDLL